MAFYLAQKKFPFYISITAIVVFITFSLTGLFLWISHKESRTAAIKTADRLFGEINQKVIERYETAMESVAVLSGTVALMPSMTTIPKEDGLDHPGVKLMLQELEHYGYLYSLYAGYADGSFLQIIAAREDVDSILLYKAPAKTYFIVRTITSRAGVGRRQIWRFLDFKRRFLGGRDEDAPSYDPRRKSWYREALQSEEAIFTDPYVFGFAKIPGITCAEKLMQEAGVFGCDITLERFAESLRRQKVSENGKLFLFDRKGRLIVHPSEDSVKTSTIRSDENTERELGFIKGEESDDEFVRAVVASFKTPGGISVGKSELIKIQDNEYLVRLSEMKPELNFDAILGSVAPVSDFTGHIRRMQIRIFVFSILVFAIVMPLVLWMSRRISRSMMMLEKEADKVRRFDFSESEPFDSMIKEIHSHIQAFNLMKSTIRQRTDALIATQKKLEKLVKSGIALSAEQDMDKLLEMIFQSASELSRAAGGTLFLRDEKDQLQFKIVQTADQGIVRGKILDTSDGIRTVPLYHPDSGDENHDKIESHVTLTGKTVVVQETDSDQRFDLSRTCQFDENTDVPCSSLLTVPLKPRQGKPLGVLQLFNNSGNTTGFDGEIVGFVEALASQAAIALNNKKLLEAQRELFNAFIQLLAGAIDAKSPYTGGHCARVPEVANMLARAASNSEEEAFLEFKIQTEDEWREFQIAAWLHDCGKVTTPEYVVDKATKLETIYNRIHEIRTRFEVLWRDREIACYQKMLSGKHDESGLRLQLKKEQEQIREDFAFVAECNVGGEFMADEKIERLKQIASKRWVRHLDDGIGLSQDEEYRKRNEPPKTLPVEECLLMDRPEHIFERVNPDPFDGNPLKFKMDVPEHLYNNGELYNLCIRKGTLSDEERFKINEHIIQTLLMLRKLPFPSYLINVPEIAGAHHETMIGTGYPRQLKKDEMSVPARIMAISDIFEALTARDRPYKKPKTLSESLRIMSLMRDDQHIDPELFELFLTSKVYQNYAEKFLDPSQIDQVDIRQFL
jgi:HD-GYP domain-containing protein (c-di-GMP phosphodiesterase class II)